METLILSAILTLMLLLGVSLFSSLRFGRTPVEHDKPKV